MAAPSSEMSRVGYVASLAEVVEIILSFSPARFLSVAAQVCRLWRDTARRIMRARQKLGWLSFVACHGIVNTPCTSKVGIQKGYPKKTKIEIKCSWFAKLI